MTAYSSSLEFLNPDFTTKLALPLMGCRVQAGFPSPADDYLDLPLDLNKELISNPDATFYARVSGLSMIDAGLDEGDILVIDRSKNAKSGDLAVCFLDGDFTVKEIRLEDKRCFLVPHNKSFPRIEVSEEQDFTVWGIVTYVIKKK